MLVEGRPLFSIIITCYKVEKYIEQVVESVTNQNFINKEIILVDDGSPDRCGSIIDRLAENDSTIKTIHKDNGGPGSARNAGFEAASGEYIFFLDGDDRMVEGTLIAAYNFLQTNNSCDIITSNWHYYTNWEKQYIRKECFNLDANISNEKLKLKLACDTYLSHSFYLRRLLINNAFPFDTKMKLAEDQEWLLNNVHSAQNIGVINTAFYYHYEARPGSQVNGFTEEKFIPTLSTWSNMHRCIEQLYYTDISKKYLRHMTSTVFMQIASKIIIECKNYEIVNETKKIVINNSDILTCNENKWRFLFIRCSSKDIRIRLLIYQFIKKYIR